VRGGDKQSGVLVSRTKNQMQISKLHYNTKSATNFKHQCALVCRVNVGFGINQQLTRLCVTTRGSVMQSGAVATRTENRMQISKIQCNTKSATNINAHMHIAFTSDLASISIWHNAVRPFTAAQCRAVQWLLEQRIRSKLLKKIQDKISTKIQMQIRTTLFLSHSRQLCLQSAARTPPPGHFW
jgi:hypothetical protein